MAKGVRRSGPELIEERSISFKREDKGLFRKVETITQKDIYTYQVMSKTVNESDELYRQTISDDFEHELTFNDIDGTEIKMRLKAVDPKEWSQS